MPNVVGGGEYVSLNHLLEGDGRETQIFFVERITAEGEKGPFFCIVLEQRAQLIRPHTTALEIAETRVFEKTPTQEGPRMRRSGLLC